MWMGSAVAAHRRFPHRASECWEMGVQGKPFSSPAVPFGSRAGHLSSSRCLGKFRGKVHSSWEESQTAEQQGAAQAKQRSCSVSAGPVCLGAWESGWHWVRSTLPALGQGRPSPKACSPLVGSKLTDENTGHYCFSWHCSQLKFLLIPVLP